MESEIVGAVFRSEDEVWGLHDATQKCFGLGWLLSLGCVLPAWLGRKGTGPLCLLNAFYQQFLAQVGTGSGDVGRWQTQPCAGPVQGHLPRRLPPTSLIPSPHHQVGLPGPNEMDLWPGHPPHMLQQVRIHQFKCFFKWRVTILCTILALMSFCKWLAFFDPLWRNTFLGELHFGKPVPGNMR